MEVDSSAAPPSYDEVILGFTTGFSSNNEPIPLQSLRSPINLRSQQLHTSTLNQTAENEQSWLQRQRLQNMQLLNQVHSRPPEQIGVVRQRQLHANIGRKSELRQCPYCGHNIQTKTSSVINETTHVMAFMLCFLGCFLCSCIPYFVNTCKDIKHFCPECDSFLGLNDITDSI